MLEHVIIIVGQNCCPCRCVVQVGRVRRIVIAKVEFHSIHCKGVFLGYSQLRKSHVFVLMHVFKGV